MIKLTDRWTTQHGSWDVRSDKKYGIDQAHRDRYLAGRDIPPAGADHHIVVRAKPGSPVRCYTLVNGRVDEDVVYTTPASGWADHEMSKGSFYNAQAGEKGPWFVEVDGDLVAEGIGMPQWEHVSTFLYTEELADSEPVWHILPPTEGEEVWTAPQPGAAHTYQITIVDLSTGKTLFTGQWQP